ncbi:Lysophospholipid acyltransferase [Erysiphe necator]|uniref:Putative mboat family protein n=1 Tax=Uncinula necator TaxID=52586 RepID=A0A0B1P087_UNCNE|nr:Lysophospholipid acyltransferase [Erysiphe necator]KHJ30705.1 putative mboat family protein [Erysiphe necator]
MLPYISIPFEYVSSILGPSPDELKLMASFFLSFPLAGLLKRIPDNKPSWKNLYIISASLFYLVGLFDLWSGIRTLLISSTFTYCAAKYISGPFMPWIVFIFAMGHLSLNQLTRQFVNDPGVVDITGAQMILTIKLTSFAWNVADGQLPKNSLTGPQKEKALECLPSVLDFAGFIMFFPSLFAGPAFDFVDYKRWIEMEMFDIPIQGTDGNSSKLDSRKIKRVPQNFAPAMLKAASGVMWIILFMKLSTIYYPKFLTEDIYMTYRFPRRVWILHLLCFTTRLKYYGVWALTEAACILSGFGYAGINPATGKASWNNLRHVDPIGVETAQNTRAYLGSWNINTNNWLRNYIYLRVTPRGKKPGFRASLATFISSALWHGFYPGYYLSFILASFVQTVAKNFRRYLRPFFVDPSTSKPTSLKSLYDIFSYIVTQLSFSFITAPFIFLDLESSFLVWSRVYFYGIIGTAVSTIFFASPAKQMLIKKLDEMKRKEKLNTKFKSTSDTIVEPVLGIPSSIENDLKEIVQEFSNKSTSD